MPKQGHYKPVEKLRTKIVGTALNEEQCRALWEAAEAESMTVSCLVRRLILNHLWLKHKKSVGRNYSD